MRGGPDWRTPEAARRHINAEGYLVAPPLDITGYLESIARCRHDFPDLHIMTGVEWGQPHLFEQQARELLDLGSLDRIASSWKPGSRS